MKKSLSVLIILLLVLSLSVCKKSSQVTEDAVSDTGAVSKTDVSTSNMDFTFTDRDSDSSYDEASSTVISEGTQEVKITKSGTYIITGEHTGITVDAGDSAKIQIVLKAATITAKSAPAIYIKNADKVFITLADGTKNILSDSAAYSLSDDESTVDGTIFSKADLTINGSGSLQITANYKCAIVSKDDLVISDSAISINSVGTAIEGKDCVKIKNARLDITAGSDGIKSTNTEDSARGYIYIESGSIDITAENDGIQAETVLKILDGDYTIKTGGGSENASTSSKGAPSGGWGSWDGDRQNSTEATETESAKGLKSGALLQISGGGFEINSSDDSLHSNGDLEVSGGTFTCASGDDGFHADDSLIISAGTIKITKSYEGLEGNNITISGGEIDLNASDDGLNSAGGNDGSSVQGRPGQNNFSGSSNCNITISGGYITVNASGDGVDSNGNINISGGILLVSGPENSGNGSLDYEGSATITGGVAILTGSSGMAQTFSSSSAQYSLMYTLTSAVTGGTSVAIADSSGNVIASFLPSKQYNNIVISAPALKNGEEYKLLIGGSISGCDKNGYSASGKVSSPLETLDVTISSVATTYGSSGGMGGGMGGGGKPRW